MNNNENNGFNYTYSAKEQAELKKIREKYRPQVHSAEMDKMAHIRRLDASVTKKGTVVSLCLGIIGALVMGLGMSLIMTDLKDILGAYRDQAMIFGIVIGLIGMIAVVAAYPLYQHITERERRKIAPEILRLTEELLEENR